jgi:HAD superfamily hydrolase (TIGR01490 family)
MRAAVFSDVEGTLIDGSLPQIFLDLGEQMGVYSPWQRARIRAVRKASQPWGSTVRRRALILSMIIAMGGQSPETIQHMVDRSMPTLMARIKPGTISRIQAHQQAGLPLVLVSAGMHPVIAGLGTALNGRGEGTKMQIRNGRFREQLDGPLYQGEAKAARANALMDEMDVDPQQSYAYGDTANDIPFLSLFGHPHAVDPDPALAAHALRHAWTIVDGARRPA